MNGFSWNRFETAPLVAILRGFPDELIPRIVEGVVRGGFVNLEITLNTPNAEAQIRRAVDVAAGRLHVGAGTVLDLDGLDRAVGAGASFIVTPSTNAAVVGACVRRGIPVVPGALTPTEIHAAWERGARWVKVFPADRLGPAFIRQVKEILPAIRLMPTGGVGMGSLAAYREAGASGCGIGSPLFEGVDLEGDDGTALSARCRELLRAWRAG
ncbi:MAG: bifunctional 4-hydroxy-2-oxoglutarate aldolase/2-dehydro-3-deoxy-phosphogluconate aldolase [Verrucomicrobiales bacterium]|nr:bifunctional 4-hydroxy-2-oxoglutarate aldolase/2-dehydro-3-deoxy-phosphogluconate aldolase [Verrucomicrobiales bacterium]